MDSSDPFSVGGFGRGRSVPSQLRGRGGISAFSNPVGFSGIFAGEFYTNPADALATFTKYLTARRKQIEEAGFATLDQQDDYKMMEDYLEIIKNPSILGGDNVTWKSVITRCQDWVRRNPIRGTFDRTPAPIPPAPVPTAPDSLAPTDFNFQEPVRASDENGIPELDPFMAPVPQAPAAPGSSRNPNPNPNDRPLRYFNQSQGPEFMDPLPQPQPRFQFHQHLPAPAPGRPPRQPQRFGYRGPGPSGRGHGSRPRYPNNNDFGGYGDGYYGHAHLRPQYHNFGYRGRPGQRFQRFPQPQVPQFEVPSYCYNPNLVRPNYTAPLYTPFDNQLPQTSPGPVPNQYEEPEPDIRVDSSIFESSPHEVEGDQMYSPLEVPAPAPGTQFEEPIHDNINDDESAIWNDPEPLPPQSTPAPKNYDYYPPAPASRSSVASGFNFKPPPSSSSSSLAFFHPPRSQAPASRSSVTSGFNFRPPPPPSSSSTNFGPRSQAPVPRPWCSRDRGGGRGARRPQRSRGRPTPPWSSSITIRIPGKSKSEAPAHPQQHQKTPIKPKPKSTIISTNQGSDDSESECGSRASKPSPGTNKKKSVAPAGAYKLPDNLIFNPSKVTDLKSLTGTSLVKFRLNQLNKSMVEKKEEDSSAVDPGVPSGSIDDDISSPNTSVSPQNQNQDKLKKLKSPSPRPIPKKTPKSKPPPPSPWHNPRMAVTVRKKDAIHLHGKAQIARKSTGTSSPSAKSSRTGPRPRRAVISSSESEAQEPEAVPSESNRRVRKPRNQSQKSQRFLGTASVPSATHGKKKRKKTTGDTKKSDDESEDETEFQPPPPKKPNNNNNTRTRTGTGNNTKPKVLTRAKKAETMKREEILKRLEFRHTHPISLGAPAYFPIRKVVGPWDMVVNQGLGKIKMESDYIPPGGIKDEPGDEEVDVNEYAPNPADLLEQSMESDELEADLIYAPAADVDPLGEINFGELIIPKEEPIDDYEEPGPILKEEPIDDYEHQNVPVPSPVPEQTATATAPVPAPSKYTGREPETDSE